MPIEKRTLRFLQTLTDGQRRALKALAVGCACVAALTLVTMAQVTMDRMASNVEPAQTHVATQGK